MRTIQLVNSDLVALVDDADYNHLSQFSWSLVANCYAARYEGAHDIFYMHREITQVEPTTEIDHADRDGLNNQRYNLRECTHSLNLANARKHRDAVHSIYKGVSRNFKTTRWVASIGVDYKVIPLGTFDTEYAAALAYNRAAVCFFGEFARINSLPPEPPEYDVPVLPRPTTSAYRGVCWEKSKRRWLAQIKKSGRTHYLGVFQNEEDAALAYDAAARQLHGTNAQLNFPCL